jgi:hypothetical protein
MSLRLITADERMAEQAGVKVVILGPTKIGKTTLLRTLDAPRTMMLNIEAGDLAVRDVPYQELRPDTGQWSWPELRNVAARLGGPNPASRSDQAYSQEHYDHVARELQIDLEGIDTLFVDSITVASRICMAWCLAQPEAFSERTGKPDTRGAYGLLGREMISWLMQLQHAKGKNVVFVGILDAAKDDYGRQTWDPQIEGQATGRALLGIVDQVVTMAKIDFEGASGVRSFVCQQGNPWGFPAGDRSGKLDMVEEPHLGKLIAKCADRSSGRQEISTQIPQV